MSLEDDIKKIHQRFSELERDACKENADRMLEELLKRFPAVGKIKRACEKEGNARCIRFWYDTKVNGERRTVDVKYDLMIKNHPSEHVIATDTN